jgi:hypothetical protein
VVGCHDMVELGPNIVKLQPTIPMQILITPLLTFGQWGATIGSWSWYVSWSWFRVLGFGLGI